MPVRRLHTRREPEYSLDQAQAQYLPVEDTLQVSPAPAIEENVSSLSPEALKEALNVYRQIDINVDPSQQLLQLLATQKLASHTKVAYQTKNAFLDDSQTLDEVKDRFGSIKVKLKNNRYIDLAFQEEDVQSRLNIRTPKRPELKYIQTMLVAPLLFKEQEDLQNILVIGHGGGSIAKYYSDFYPSKRKTVVDIRPLLFDISKEYFDYTPDANTSFVSSDASVFLSKARSSGEKYDIINIDIFFDGPSDVQLNHYFWDNVSSALSSNGVSVTNVWKGEHIEKYDKILAHHMSVFNTVFEITNSDTFQVALFGSNIPYEMLMHPNLPIKAVEMFGLTSVDFRTHIGNIRRVK